MHDCADSAAAAAQSGVLECNWEIDHATLALVLVPLGIYPTVPDDASHCSVAVDFHQCGGGLALQDFRVETMLTDFRAGGEKASITASYDELMAGIRTRVDDAGILPEWVSPERGNADYGDCTDLASSAITTTLHPLHPAANGDSGDGFGGSYYALSHSGMNSCTFEIPDPSHPLPSRGTFSVSYLPGGSWVWPLSDGDPIVVAGADEAVSRCYDAGYCVVEARVGDTWVNGGFGNTEYDLSKAAEYLAAIIPSLPIEEV